MDLAQQLRFVKLPDGRRIAYRELGCQRQNADKTLLVLHGLMSSRRVAMPGASEDLLEKYGLRMIAIDRPGYGQSDPHCAQTFKSTSQDIEYMMDELDLGEKIWLLGFSMGGAYCWGAARHIPDRLAGIAMASPAGNFWWKSIPLEDQRAIVESYPLSDRIISSFNKTAPFPMIRMYTQFLSDVLLNPSTDTSSGLCPPDRECLTRPGVASFFFRDRQESLKKNKGFGIAKDYELLNRGWDFDLKDVKREFKGKKIHIWHGDVDTVVPYRLQQCVHRAIPEVVDFHSLHNHGHFSWFCFDPTAPFEILATLFGEQEHHQDDEPSTDPKVIMV
ncbi:hypothetical protein GOP47_0000606 [Adiantum capillus-veneris]|uniref:AB hydrolase-1 domain-containing protein n=1 Tax=Adiantum capillus-veneris TaxID=13818 RepID=A0A9D4VDV1_ADICA|nr:hypothetical protein GOP47_0000606 [Adiantum capillus-veneris]